VVCIRRRAGGRVAIGSNVVALSDVVSTDDRERKCVDTIGTVLVRRAGHFQCQSINIFFQIKYTEAISPNSTRKLLRFEISKMPIAV